jgi:hypothetical protein
MPFPAPRSPLARERCVSPTSATDYLSEHQQIAQSLVAPHLEPVFRRVASCAPDHPRAEAPRGGFGEPPVRYQVSHPGGASFDGEPPASTIVARRRFPIGLSPVGSAAAPRGPGGAAIAGSSSLRLPSRALFARRRARDTVSDVPCRDPRRTSYRYAVPMRFGSPGFESAAASSKAAPCLSPGRLPSSECSLPRSRRTLSRLRVGSRGARHRSRLHACIAAFAAAIRLPTLVRPSSSRAHRARAVGLDPGLTTWTERRSSTSATTAIHEHGRVDRSTPAPDLRCTLRHALSRCVALVPRPLEGFGELLPGSPTRLAVGGPERRFRVSPRRPSAHGPGAGAMRLPGRACEPARMTPHVDLRAAEAALASNVRFARPRPDPLGHLSS